jgi:hypothetical protein
MNNTNKKQGTDTAFLRDKVNPLRKVIQNYPGLVPLMLSTEIQFLTSSRPEVNNFFQNTRMTAKYKVHHRQCLSF